MSVDQASDYHPLQPVEQLEAQARRRRFVGLAVPRPRALRRAQAITEGTPTHDVYVREGLYRRALAMSDAVAAGLVLWLVIGVRAGGGLNLWIFAAMPLMVVVNKVAGLYERDEIVLKKTTLDEAPALIQITGLFSLLVWLGHADFFGAVPTPNQVLLLWGGTFAALLLGRALARAVVARVARPERCFLIGDQAALIVLRRKLEAARVNAEVVGDLVLSPSTQPDPERFRELIATHDVHRVVVAPVTTDALDTLDLIRLAKSVGVRVSVLPRLFEVVGSSVEFDHLDGLTMLGVRRFGLTRSSRVLKRGFDLAGASVGLLAVAPILLVIALAVRLDSRGPIFFRQTRVGMGGRRFHIFKFRSMVPDAEARRPLCDTSTRRRACSRSPTTLGSRAWAGSSARRRWMSSRSC